MNVATIIVGTLIGSLWKKGLKERFRERIMEGIGFVAISIGIANIVKGMESIKEPIIFIVSVALGAILGEWINLDEKIEKLSDRFQGKESPIQGIIIGFVLFCIGALSILGSIESAINGDNTLLFTNGILNGITSVILATTYGMGIMVLAVIIFFWQGAIYLGANLIEPLMIVEVLSQFTLLGGILILATGVNILKLGNVKVLNLLPMIILPLLLKIVGLI